MTGVPGRARQPGSGADEEDGVEGAVSDAGDTRRDPADGVPHRRRPWLALAAAVGVVVVDQLTKWWALETLTGRAPIELVGSLQFNLRYNTGAAFSLGSDLDVGPFIAVLAVVVVVLLLRSPAASATRTGALAAGLIAGGAAGNIVDRAFRAGAGGFFEGAVVDFIDLQWWPVFNVADMAICVGAVAFVLVGLRDPTPSR